MTDINAEIRRLENIVQTGARSQRERAQEQLAPLYYQRDMAPRK